MTEGLPPFGGWDFVWQAATNGVGRAVILEPPSPRSNQSLSRMPGFAIDSNGFIYTIQFIQTRADPAYSLMSFSPTRDTGSHGWIGRSRCTQNCWKLTVSQWTRPAPLLPRRLGRGWHRFGKRYNRGALPLQRNQWDFIATLTNGGDAYYDVAWDKVASLHCGRHCASLARLFGRGDQSGHNRCRLSFKLTTRSCRRVCTMRRPARTGWVSRWKGQSNVTTSSARID